MGPTGEMMLTYRATNALLTNNGCGAVLTVTGDAGKSLVTSKNNGGVAKSWAVTILTLEQVGINYRVSLKKGTLVIFCLISK